MPTPATEVKAAVSQEAANLSGDAAKAASLGKTAATSGYVEATTNVGALQGANYAKIVAEGTASFAGTFFVDDLKLAPI